MGVFKSLLFPGGRRVRTVQGIYLTLVIISTLDREDFEMDTFSLVFIVGTSLVLSGAPAFVLFGLLDAKNHVQYAANGQFARDLIREYRA